VSGNIARVAGFELFVSVSQQAFTTQTGFLVGTGRVLSERLKKKRRRNTASSLLTVFWEIILLLQIIPIPKPVHIR
jgi:hypothetical protein